MRVIHFVLLLLTYIACVLFERQYQLIPFTWMFLVFSVYELKLPFFSILLLSVCTDFVLALPIGLSAGICGITLYVMQFSPKKIFWRSIFFGCFGIIQALVYGWQIQSISIQSIVVSSLLFILLYTIGRSTATIEEIGNVSI